MHSLVKIAIYSGEIPSTTFIENLIEGLSDRHEISLFGIKKGKVSYRNSNISVMPLYQNRLMMLASAFYWAVRNFLKNPSIFVKLKNHIFNINTSFLYKFRYWNKYGPVVYNRPDIFHIQWAKGVSEWLFLKELFEIQIVVSFRGSHINHSYLSDDLLEEQYLKAFPDCDGYHAVSDKILNNALPFGVDISKAEIIPPAIEDSFLKRSPLAKKRSGKLKILSVGRNHWVKAYDVAIDACGILASKNIDFSYTIVGVENSEELIFQINQLNLNQSVHLMGRLPQSQVWDLYKEADLFLLPSHSEGIANVVLEAMTFGVPVISTRCGGMESVITHQENGWLIPLRNPQALAEQIIEFMDLSEEKIESILVSAFETVKKDHRLSKQVSQMEELYYQVLSSKERSL